MVRPSWLTRTLAPSASSSVAIAVSRSVSCPRMWATPRMWLVSAASAAIAATTGVSSLASRRSISMLSISSVPADRERPVVAVRDVGAELLQDPRHHDSRLAAVGRPVRHGHLAAGDRRGGQERGGVGQVGLDDHVLGADRTGTDQPAIGLAVVDLHAAGPQHRRRSSRCGGGTGGRHRRAAGRVPARSRAPISSSPETYWLEVEASTVTAPPASSRCPVTVNGSPVPAISAPSADSAVSSGPIGRAYACSSPSNRDLTRRPGQPTAAGSASRCRPVRSPRCPRPRTQRAG